jgi:hypothetical protein
MRKNEIVFIFLFILIIYRDKNQKNGNMGYKKE